MLLDYIQRTAPPGEHGDKRGSVDATMNSLRQFADAGTAVVVVSAVGRTKDNRGRSSYDGDGLNLASFRESPELEFGADDAFILVPDPKADDLVTLRHLKARHSEAHDLELRFDRRLQRFTPLAAGTRLVGNNEVPVALRTAWETTMPAEECDPGGTVAWQPESPLHCWQVAKCGRRRNRCLRVPPWFATRSILRTGGGIDKRGKAVGSPF